MTGTIYFKLESFKTMTICKYMKEEEEGGWIIHMKAV